MARIDGKWCCECDYCAVSACEPSPIYSIFFTDHATTHDYILHCAAHEELAHQATAAYLAAHPGVEVDPNE